MKQASESELSVPALGAVLLTVMAQVLLQLVLAAFTLLSAKVHGESHAVASTRVLGNLGLLTLSQLVGLGCALWLGLRWFSAERSTLEGLSLFPIRRRTAALCLLAGACLQFPLTELSNLLHHHVLGADSLERQLAVQRLLEAHSLGQGMLVITCLVAAVPLTEELFFRGLLLFGMRTRYGNAAAVAGSACLFGISHLDPVAVVYATVAGLVLGVLALRTGSVWPGVALHAAVNAMPVLLPERLLPVHGFNVPSVVPLHLPVSLVLSTLLASALLLAIAVKVEYGEPS